MANYMNRIGKAMSQGHNKSSPGGTNHQFPCTPIKRSPSLTLVQVVVCVCVCVRISRSSRLSLKPFQDRSGIIVQIF